MLADDFVEQIVHVADRGPHAALRSQGQPIGHRHEPAELEQGRILQVLHCGANALVVVGREIEERFADNVERDAMHLVNDVDLCVALPARYHLAGQLRHDGGVCLDAARLKGLLHQPPLPHPQVAFA